MDARKVRDKGMETYLQPTWFLDSDHPEVAALARSTCDGCETDVERAVRLFRAVRDEIRYTVKVDFTDPDAYRASATLARGDGFCVPKSILLAALLRAEGVPSRLHFADLRNRLVPDDLRAMMHTDVFVFHGYVEAFLEGTWRKATPSFDPGTCRRRNIKTVEFDGRSDALLHRESADGRFQFEYLRDRGVYDDLPFEDILRVLVETYPHYDPEAWSDAFDE